MPPFAQGASKPLSFVSRTVGVSDAVLGMKQRCFFPCQSWFVLSMTVDARYDL